jgi:hypothetical protein
MYINDDDADDDDFFCLSKKTPLLNTHAFTPVESELNTLSVAVAAPKLRLAGTDPYICPIAESLSVAVASAAVVVAP